MSFSKCFCVWVVLMYSICPFQGIFISRVSEEGPAARAGVKVGDKLLEVNICFHFLFWVAPFRTSHSRCFKSSILAFALSGERSRPAWSRASHSCRSPAQLAGGRGYDHSARTHGWTRERHHHHATETRRWLFPPGETVQWAALPPGPCHSCCQCWTDAATSHFSGPQR